MGVGTRTALSLAVAACCCLVGAVDASAAGRSQSPLLGASFEVPPGVQLLVEPMPTPGPGQIVEQVRLLGDGDQLVTLDMWRDPLRLGAAGALAAALSWLMDKGSELRVVAGGRRRVPTLLLLQPRSPQRHGRHIALLGSGGVVARITCEDSADPRAVLAFERALASFDGAGARP